MKKVNGLRSLLIGVMKCTISKAIEKVGEERIKKYYFDIDDADCEKQKEEK